MQKVKINIKNKENDRNLGLKMFLAIVDWKGLGEGRRYLEPAGVVDGIEGERNLCVVSTDPKPDKIRDEI